MSASSDRLQQMRSGFGNHLAAEAVPGALPQGRNSPQRGALGRYAGLLSGSAFTSPRRQPAQLAVPPPALGGVRRPSRAHPDELDHTPAFMFECRYRFMPTAFAMNGGALDTRYADCWANLKDSFSACDNEDLITSLRTKQNADLSAGVF